MSMCYVHIVEKGVLILLILAIPKDFIDTPLSQVLLNKRPFGQLFIPFDAIFIRVHEAEKAFRNAVFLDNLFWTVLALKCEHSWNENGI